MKYNDPSFTVPLGGKKFGDGWDVIFKGVCPCKCCHTDGTRHTEEGTVACCFVCDACGLDIRRDAEDLHAMVCDGKAD